MVWTNLKYWKVIEIEIHDLVSVSKQSFGYSNAQSAWGPWTLNCKGLICTRLHRCNRSFLQFALQKNCTIEMNSSQLTSMEELYIIRVIWLTIIVWHYYYYYYYYLYYYCFLIGLSLLHLFSVQPAPGGVSTPQQQDLLNAQLERIHSLFRRQLSVPLLGNVVPLLNHLLSDPLHAIFWRFQNLRIPPTKGRQLVTASMGFLTLASYTCTLAWNIPVH